MLKMDKDFTADDRNKRVEEIMNQVWLKLTFLSNQSPLYIALHSIVKFEKM